MSKSDSHAAISCGCPTLTYEKRYEIVDFAPERCENGIFALFLQYA